MGISTTSTVITTGTTTTGTPTTAATTTKTPTTKTPTTADTIHQTARRSTCIFEQTGYIGGVNNQTTPAKPSVSHYIEKQSSQTF
jgi:hypothetical protein